MNLNIDKADYQVVKADYRVVKADYQAIKDLLRHWGEEADDVRWMVDTRPKDSMVNCNFLEAGDDKNPEIVVSLRCGRVASLRCGNGKDSIPSAIAKLTNLHTLDLSVAKITALPTEFGSLETLQVLGLALCQQLSELPDVVTRLPNLRVLDLYGCRFENLPSIGNLQRLRVLKLTKLTRMSQLPDEIGNLINLTELDLSDCWKLTSLPPSIWNLKNLKDLDLRRTGLLELPEAIGNLERLEELELGGCAIQTLPSAIGDLERLKSLSLADCDIQALPPTIVKLKHLEWLHLGTMKNLVELPQDIGNLTQLRMLELGDTSLQSLPSSMKKLTKLEHLGLEFTTLTLVSEENIGHLLGLQRLRVTAFRDPEHGYSNAFEILMELVQRCPSLGWMDLPHGLGKYGLHIPSGKLRYGMVIPRETLTLEYALACNRARTRMGLSPLGETTDDAMTEARESSIKPALWPHLLDKGSVQKTFDWYPAHKFSRPSYTIENSSAIYQLLVDGRESFLDAITHHRCTHNNAKKRRTCP